MAITANDIITNAMIEIGALAVGETLGANDGAWALTKLNDLVDEWNSRSVMIFNVSFTNYTLTANHQPHTIGLSTNSPAPNFASAENRPNSIHAAAIILNNVTPNVTVPLMLVDDDWWANQRVKSLATSLPRYLYYSPDYPNGSLFLWPIPTVAYGIEIEISNLITEFPALTTAFTLPMGYRKAITLTLAVDMFPSFYGGNPPSPVLVANAAKARSALQSANTQSPTISLRDAGIPNQQAKNRTNWNYLTGNLK